MVSCRIIVCCNCWPSPTCRDKDALLFFEGKTCGWLTGNGSSRKATNSLTTWHDKHQGDVGFTKNYGKQIVKWKSWVRDLLHSIHLKPVKLGNSQFLLFARSPKSTMWTKRNHEMHIIWCVTRFLASGKSEASSWKLSFIRHLRLLSKRRLCCFLLLSYMETRRQKVAVGEIWR